jgi:hypothetical protein
MPRKTEPARIAAQPAPTRLPLQRNVSQIKSCACGGGCPACRNKPEPFARLRVSESGDLHEQEADAMAARVMSGDRGPVRSGSAIGLIQRSPRSHTPAPGAPLGLAAALGTASQALDLPTREFMESRFDRSFAHVRVHTGPEASESAGDLGARAYTFGNHIVFGADQYAPTSGPGRSLLAHELAHVAQQDDGRNVGVVQRAEVDDRSCAGLTDIESDVDAKVNSEIAAARTAAGTPIAAAAVPAFLSDVMTRIGLGAISPIESFVEGLPASKRNKAPNSLVGTKYEGVDAVNRFYKLQTLGSVHVVGAAAKIHGFCVGADKLGHFFEEGFTYFDLMSSAGASQATVEKVGRGFEIGKQGLAITGVFSNADLAANLAGEQFYKDLKANPSGLTFSIKNYITAKWSEQSNPSFYSSAEGAVVWNNLLTGPWEGSFTSAGGTSSPIDVRADLTATTGSVTGTYQWPIVKPAQKGKIKNGTITQKTTSVSGIGVSGGALTPVSDTPVSGVSIAFDWEEGTSSGKGKWDSVNEQTLDGTWGIGASRTSGGNWRMKKV